MKKIINKEKNILEVLSEIYIFILLLVFPLVVDKTGFFHILECKWYFYVTIASTYILLCILVILYFLIFKKTNYFKTIKLSIVHWLVISFLLINIVSCFFSPYYDKYNLYIGVGRGEGLIAISLYILSFFFVSLFSKFKRIHIVYFSISSILISFVAVLQYIGFNPFNMYQEGIGTHNVSFMTTIGNIDFISAVYCILLSVSFGAYIFLDDNKKYEKLIHILSIFMGFFIIGIINVQSGKVAFFGTFVLLLPFLIINNKRLSRLLLVIATFLMSYCLNVILNPEYHYDIQKLKLYYQFNYIVVLFIIVCALLIYLSFVLKKVEYDFSSNMKFIKIFYLTIVCCGIVGMLFLYYIDFNSGILYEIHELLHGNFDDSFGTYRVFLWKRTIKLIPEYPLLGSGPDTFALRFMEKYTSDVATIGPLTINDTAANVYLTMIINIGTVGLLNYLSFIILQISNGIKRINNYSSILLIAIICYLIQDFFNLSVIIVTPLFWLLMAMHLNVLCCKN